MSQVISFEQYSPPARYDNVPWAQVKVEEGDTSEGDWTLIDTLILDPLDADPSRPQARNLTTDQASDSLNLWYRLIFVDGSNDVSQPTSPVQNRSEEGSRRDYISRDYLKRTLEMSSLSFADQDIDSSISAASRAIDEMCGRRFWSDIEENTRTYFPIPSWSRVEIDDIFDLTNVKTMVGSNTYTLTEGTDYVMVPLNAAADGRPAEAIQFLKTRSFPDLYRPSVLVTGLFGWETVPAGVVTAATILSTRLLRRQREAPFGIVTVGIEQGAVARIAREDPDVQKALCDVVKDKVMIS